MTRAVWMAATVACVACGSPPRPAMYPAGSDKDDGYGDLAQKSARLLIGDSNDSALLAPRRGRRSRLESGSYGGDPYGGAMYGGDAYGGPDQLVLVTPPPPIPPSARYTPSSGLTGAIEGTVTWRGALPRPLTTPCGSFDNPSPRVAPNRAVSGVLVYIEHVELGRTLPTIGDRQVSVGGIVTKRGCALGPALQILTPLPADLTIHGDATEAVLRITGPGGARPFELQPGGRIVISAQPGVTRIEADDASLAPAWVIASSTPYYAITDERGRFRIDELATGAYEVTFWQPPLASTASGKVVYGAPVVVHRSIHVEAARPAHLDLALP
jgi:hypothetical protein